MPHYFFDRYELSPRGGRKSVGRIAKKANKSGFAQINMPTAQFYFNVSTTDVFSNCDLRYTLFDAIFL